jgi:hypothetical protein
MMPNLQALTQRRAQLITDIQRERGMVRSTLAVIRQDLVYAVLGLMAGRLLTHHAGLRTVTLAVLAVAAASSSRLTRKSKP